MHSIHPVKKYWIILLFGTFTTCAIYLALHSRSLTLTSPQSLAKPTYEDTTMDERLKLWYPVEHALFDLFPKETNAILANSHHMDKPSGNILKNWFSPPSFSWAHYYTTIQAPSSYRCQDVPIPYPILRHLVKQVLQLNESTIPTWSPNLSQPFLLLPFDSNYRTMTSGEAVCIRAIIPPSVLTKHPTTPFHYRYQPYSTFASKYTTATTKEEEWVWWDMMQVSARHLVSNASTSLRMRPWHGHKVLHDAYQKQWFEHENNIPNWSRQMMEDMAERGWLHIYETDVVLVDPGHYVLEGQLEYQDAYWNTDLGPVQPYQPLSMAVEPQAGWWVDKNQVSVQQLVLDHLELPPCQGADHAGRWLPWPFGHLVAPFVMVTGVDKHNKFWAPFTCRYQPMTHQQFHQCLAHRFPRGLNIYGDSNMRRSIKSFLSHGQWCKNYHLYDNTTTTTRRFDTPQDWEYIGEPTQLRACHCEDFKETTWNPAWFNATARRCDLVFGGVRVSSYKWDGLTFMNDQGWQAGFTLNPLPSNTDAVVISLVNWDMAYMQLDDFRQALDGLVQHLKTQYDTPLFIYRTPQYYCCRVDQTNRQRKSNTARMKLFDQVARHVLGSAFADHWMVWDVMAMGEARTWDEKLAASTCGANHAQADVIHLENQVLMNALCHP